MRDRSVDLMLLRETWLDEDSVSVRRLRADGFSVIARARVALKLLPVLTTAESPSSKLPESL